MEMKITGMGLVCSLGGNVTDVFKRMCAGECGFRPITRFEAEPYAQKKAGQLSEELENELRMAYPDEDISAAMMKRAGTEAMAQAKTTVPPERQGILLATNFGPMESLEWAWRERLDTQAMDEASYEPYDGIIAQLAEAFNCKGPRLQISMSCASGAAAASLAADVIREGRADRMLVLAYDSLTEYAWCGLSNLRTITTDVMRPFDPDRSGTIFSEGAAAMVLERPDAAATALGWVSGAATNNNAFHMTAPPKEAAGSKRVMEDALANSGLSTADLTHVCAHATSTHANDETEAGALRNLFGERLPQISVAAHKSQLGHLLGAAGLAEAVVTVFDGHHLRAQLHVGELCCRRCHSTEQLCERLARFHIASVHFLGHLIQDTVKYPFDLLLCAFLLDTALMEARVVPGVSRFHFLLFHVLVLSPDNPVARDGCETCRRPDKMLEVFKSSHILSWEKPKVRVLHEKISLFLFALSKALRRRSFTDCLVMRNCAAISGCVYPYL